MRRSSILVVASMFALGCADIPSAPLFEPQGNLKAIDYPPPPFELVYGGGTAYEQAFSWTGHFLANPPRRLAWLQFKSSDGIQFSRNARIMKHGSRVTGFGTATLPDNRTINLNTISSFDYSITGGGIHISFSGPNFTGSGGSFECDVECSITIR